MFDTIGTGLGLLYLPQIMIVNYWFDKRLSFATGIAVCGSGIGIAIFALLSEWLINEFSWKGAMLILSGVMFTCVAFSALFRKVDYIEENNDFKTALKESINFRIMRDKVFIYFAFANFISSLVYYVPILWMKDRIIKLGIGDANDAVMLMVYFGLANAFGRAVFGFIADNQSLNRIMLYSSSIIVYGITIALTTFAKTYQSMSICIVIYGAAEGLQLFLNLLLFNDY
jgi:cyanate permease